MPRAPSTCLYCGVVGHTRSSCGDLEMDRILYLCSGEVDVLQDIWQRYSELNIHKILFKKLSEVQLLMEGHLPAVIFKTKKPLNIARKYSLVTVRIGEDRKFKKETLLYSEENWNTIQNTWKDYTKTIKDNTRLLTEKSQKYLEKIRRLERDLPGKMSWYNGQITPQVKFNLKTLHNLFHVDYLAEKERLFQEQTRDNERARVRIQERLQQEQMRHAERVEVVREQDILTIREPLPVLRDTVIEAEDCPICLETLGETAKVILRCGHQMCISCMLIQTLRATAEKNVKTCQCPVCRTGYLQ